MAKKKSQSNHNAKHINKNIESDGTVTVDLKIDMNCESCARKVVKFVHSLDGVESVERGDNDWMKITVVGKVDPVKLCENVKGKIKKNVELVSPATKKKNGSGREQENQQKQQTAAAKDDSTHKKVTTAVLKMPLHCQGCIKKIQDLVRKTEGFVEMSIDKSNDLVIVKGAMDMKLLTLALKDKLNKKVEIVHAKGSGGKKGKGGSGDKEGGGKESGGGGPIVAGYNHRTEYFPGQGEYMYQGQYMYPQYVSWPEYTFNYTHATQMFNDENPNACFVM
ncbi:putative heavy metal-associated domain, HMA, heavy metal-associated domain superfamily [Helianthus anomalus]